MTPVHAHSLANAELREQYERAGFRGRVGWGQRPALLVIDLAHAWSGEDHPIGSDLREVIDNATRLVGVARSAGVPVLFTTIAYDEALAEVHGVAERKLPHIRGLRRGTKGVQLLEALDRRPEEPLIEKPRQSAFFATNLLGLLVARNVDTVVVVGCSTSGCIRSTCEHAFNYNFHVIVPAEAVGDRSPSAHDAALFDIDARFGDVESIAPVEAALVAASRGAEG
jgi:nicotinamidase-related amidase